MNRDPLPDDGIYVVNVGAQTPVGRSALKAAAAVRCGISAYQEHSFMIDRHGESMVVAPCDWIPLVMPVTERMVSLATDSLIECLKGSAQLLRGEPVPVLFALSTATLPDERNRQELVQQVRRELRKLGVVIQSALVAEGNAVGVQAIQQGEQWLRQGKGPFVAIVGVDSHLAPENLEQIDYAGRLHSINNSWGFTPGEAAGALALATGEFVKRSRMVPLARLAAIGTGTEPKLLGTKTVCIGEGLTQAFRGALSEEYKVDHSYCDLNGETYRADEFGFAVCRNREGFHDAGSFTAAAECWGDVGAASVPLQVTLATSAWSRGYAKGPSVVCWSSSANSPMRGALRLTNTWRMQEDV